MVRPKQRHCIKASRFKVSYFILNYFHAGIWHCKYEICPLFMETRFLKCQSYVMPMSRPCPLMFCDHSHGYQIPQAIWGSLEGVSYYDGLVQDCSNSSALAMELLQSCAKPSIMSNRHVSETWVPKAFTHSLVSLTKNTPEECFNIKTIFSVKLHPLYKDELIIRLYNCIMVILVLEKKTFYNETCSFVCRVDSQKWKGCNTECLIITGGIENCLSDSLSVMTQIARFMGPTWGPPGSCWPQMGPMLVPGTMLSRGSFISLFVWPKHFNQDRETHRHLGKG